MATTVQYSDDLTTIIRWVARLIALLLAVVVVIFVSGEGIRFSDLSANDFIMGSVFTVMWLGLILAWRWEGLGGILTTVGMVLFILLDFLFTGHVLRFWVFFPFLIPGLLFLYCSWQSHHTREG